MSLKIYSRVLQRTFVNLQPKYPLGTTTLFGTVKHGLFLFLLSFTFVSQAQTEKARTEMMKSVNTEELKMFQQRLQLQFKNDEKAVANYLRKNPSVKRTFVKNGSVYYLQRIGSDGNPLYINTKNKASGELIKANQLYTGGSIGVNVTGTGMVVGVWDGGQVRATHELLSGKVGMQAGQTFDGSASNFKGNNHQTHVTGTIVGKDIANQPSARGIAYNATAQNYDWTNDLAEMSTFSAGGYLISNHSYGLANDNTTPVWQFGAYDESAKSWDNLLKNTPNYLPFVAGGNEQQSNGNSTKAGYDLITGTSATKNAMTVGAVNGDKTMSSYSNWGPTDDGRVKPEIVAKGTGINSSHFADKANNPSDNAYSGDGDESSGTSYATPAAAAAGLLLQQYYNSLNAAYMKAATLKALMMTTTEDLGHPGPDSKFGWGLVNAEKAALTIKNRGTLSRIEEIATNPTANSTDEITRTVTASGCEPLIVAIGWTDDEGPEQTEANGVDPTVSRLVYEFDVMVRQVGPNTEFRPWKPVSMANRADAATLCTGWFDVNNNNYKQVRIANPVAGATYEIIIRKKTGSPEAARTIALIVTGTHVAPTGAIAQTFCAGKNVSDLAATGTGIKWYDAATGGNLLAATTALTNGTVYYASQTISGCESPRLAVTATVNTTALPTGSATQTVASGSTISALVVTGTAIKWYDAATGGNLLATTTALTNGTIYYASQTIAGCESARLAVTVNFIVTTSPPTGATAQTFCPGATVNNLGATGTAIKWYDAATGGNLLAATTALVNGTIYYASQTVSGTESTQRLPVTATIVGKGLAVTLINVGQSKSATKIGQNLTLNSWVDNFITPDGGPSLENSTQANPTLFFSENVNKTAPRYWTVYVDGCAFGTNGSVSFDILATPEVGAAQSYNSHENNAPYFSYANRDGFTELYAQNNPAFGFFLDNGTGGNIYDAGLPKGLYKVSVRYWEQKGWGSLFPATRKSQGPVKTQQDYWFRIQSKDGVGVGAARVATDNTQEITDNGTFASVMPNPVSNVLRLKVSDAKAQKVNVSLLDASGRAMLQRNFVPETNQHQEEINVSEIANGMYFLKVNADGKQSTLKVVKVQ
jgi:serine protease AprX